MCTLLAIIIVAAVVWRVYPRDKSAPPSAYFQKLSTVLAQSRIAKPVLIIDRQRLTKNIDAVARHARAIGVDVRVAMKSLPSDPLLDAISERLGTNKMMIFSIDYLKTICLLKGYVDVLLGKPMPAMALADFYQESADHAYHPDTIADIQWLVDNMERLQDYAAIAARQNLQLKVNLEIDIGIRRGGFDNTADVRTALEYVRNHAHLEFSGFMGYEKHVYYVAFTDNSRQRLLEECLDFYQSCKRIAREVFGDTLPVDELTWNAAGSVTYPMYHSNAVANELTIGSCFVKPAHFDTRTLAMHEPALYIATLVLKTAPHFLVPGLPWLARLLSYWDVNRRRSFFIFGGLWNAAPVSPQGLAKNGFFGGSSNQECYFGAEGVDLKPGDYVFFRPNESEAVITQFNEILVYDDGEIVDTWQPLPPAP
ncbi:MAG: alanine racemase [Halioglobus sp.]|nr:alanine racemase [Halioglobus sp.]